MTTSDLFTPFWFVVAVLASWRLAKFFVFDSLMGTHLESGTKWSQRLDRWAFVEGSGENRHRVGSKVVQGATCIWCVTPYTTGLVLMLLTWSLPWHWDHLMWGFGVAVAGGAAIVGATSYKWLQS